MRMSKKFTQMKKVTFVGILSPHTHLNQNVKLIRANQVKYKISEAPITYYFLLFSQLLFISLFLFPHLPNKLNTQGFLCKIHSPWICVQLTVLIFKIAFIDDVSLLSGDQQLLKVLFKTSMAIKNLMFYSTGDQTQVLKHARHVLYY